MLTVSTHAKPELLIVMPVYNEQASIRKVVLEWFGEISNWTENFIFLALDDGSTDQTPRILGDLRQQLDSRLEVATNKNVGHGQTCLRGYHVACQRNIPHVLQIDSDGQCDPQFFFKLWRLRNQTDVIYGFRKRREDGYRRVLASRMLKVVLLLAQGVWCVDANSPYRLISTGSLMTLLPKIPPDFFLANVALAVLLKQNRTVRHAYVPIRFRERYGGEPHVQLSKFGSKAFELLRQLRKLPR